MIDALLKSFIPRADLTASEKLVVIVLAKAQDRRGSCQMSRKEIGEECGLSEATVKRCVIDLVARSVITCRRKRISPERHEKNTYSVVWLNNYNRRRNWLRKEFARQAS